MPEPQLTFTGFVLSLASTAAIHFGDLPDPVSGKRAELNLDGAAQMIEILALLDQKTRGNLSSEERQALEQVLYALRMQFVKATGAGKRTKFIDGTRVTDRETIRVVNQELEEVNRRLVAQIKTLGGRAEGIVPHHHVIVAEPHPRAAELGFVGSVNTVQTGVLREALTHHTIPVVSPVGSGGGQLYNINADQVASDVAVHLKAEKLVLLTNVRGILRQANDVHSLISTLSVKETKMLMERAIIQEGMIPKVKACVDALRGGVKKTHIIDAAIPHAMLLEIFTKQGIGTEIVR